MSAETFVLLGAGLPRTGTMSTRLVSNQIQDLFVIRLEMSGCIDNVQGGPPSVAGWGGLPHDECRHGQTGSSSSLEESSGRLYH